MYQGIKYVLLRTYCVSLYQIQKKKKRERERKIARKGSPPSGSSRSGWKKMRFKEIKVVRLFLRPGVGGGETEIQVAQMSLLGNLQFSRELEFRKLGNMEKRTLTTAFLGGGGGIREVCWTKCPVRKALKEIGRN